MGVIAGTRLLVRTRVGFHGNSETGRVDRSLSKLRVVMVQWKRAVIVTGKSQCLEPSDAGVVYMNGN